MIAKRPTVLVVDDSADVLELYERLLGQQYTLKTATNADEAFALVRDWRPVILLTDISMPGRSGLDLITQIRSDLAPPLPRIGVVSGFPDLEAEARSRGATLFLLKPFDLTSLQNGIRELLREPVAGRPAQGEAALERRAAALRKVEQFVERFIADHPSAADISTRATEHLARYLGVSTVLLLLARSGGLEVFASSEPDRFPRGAAAEGGLGYATSVIASGATLYIPTRGVLADLGELPGTDQRLVACAAVREPSGTPLAGLAVLSDHDRPFDTRDLAIIEDAAHAAQEVLLGRRELGGYAVGASRFQSEGWWRRLLDRELERVGERIAVSVALANVVRSPTERVEPSEAVFAQVSDHMMVAVRHERQLAVFKRAAGATAARDAVRRCLTTVDETLGVSAAAILTLNAIRPLRRSEVAVEILETLMAADESREARTVVNATLTAETQRFS